MKAAAIFDHNYLSLVYIIHLVCCTIIFSCSINEDDLVIPVLTGYEFPPEIMDNIFTNDIPNEIRNVNNFLDKIKENGMYIHEGVNPPEIYNSNGSNRVGIKFIINNDCIYDERAPSNVDSIYGKYEEIIRIFKDQQDHYVAEVSYSSVGDDDYPLYPSEMDKGSGTGYVSGNGNNFTIFYKVNNGSFDKIPYQALWIISGTVSDPPNAREISRVTKCLVMLEKGPDPEDKVANRGTIRIFKDETPEWIQPEVAISDFSPTEGPYSTVVTINGSGFSPTIEENIVRINDVIATVLEANSNLLRVEVPKGAGTGAITVQVINKTGTGNTFTYIPVYTVSTLAGTGQAGYVDGIGRTARFHNPNGIAVDAMGMIYVADTENDRIRVITPAEEVSTLSISFRGILFDSIFNKPAGVAVDELGDVYVTERGSIRKITTTGIFITLADVQNPIGVAVDAGGTIYVADIANHFIGKITPRGFDVLAGAGKEGYLDGFGRIAQFNNPRGVAVDDLGNVYVADTGNNLIRHITPEGEVSTLGGVSPFNRPGGVAVDAEGNIFVADMANHQIQKVTPEGEVSTLAGTGQEGFLDGIGNAAMFHHPNGVAIDAEGIIYVTDSQNHRIRKMVLE